MKTLFLIPARGGSKGVPGKNIKLLNNKALINYSIDVAREITSDENVCVSTDDAEIIKVVADYGLKVPFVRPADLATDSAGTYEVCLHALDFYAAAGIYYDLLVVLQPTSPFRTVDQVKQAIALFNEELQMVVSVKETTSNPYYVLFEEDSNGYLAKSKTGNFIGRQNCPQVWEYNGAIYVINVNELRKQAPGNFTKVKKFVMDEYSSVDIDTPIDWEWAEFLVRQGKINL